MENVKKCRKCSQEIKANDNCFIVCNGICAELFHCHCVGLRGMHWKTLKDLSRNVLWMCDCCMDDFLRSKNSNSSETTTTMQSKSIEDDINELKIAVASIMDSIASIKNVPVRAPINCESIHSPKQHSTLLDGTAYEPRDTANSDESRHTDDGINFSLLLTNIDSSATESDIQWMVSRAIGLPDPECIDVTKLVSKWKTHSNLDFVSFKVVLPLNYKSCALNPSTWPRNVRFREFIRRSNTWKPTN